MVGLQIRMFKSTVVADKKLGPKTIQYKVLALEITKAHIPPKIGSRWEIDKTTRNVHAQCVGLTGTRMGFVRLFRYQHVGIGNANPSHWGPYPM